MHLVNGHAHGEYQSCVHLRTHEHVVLVLIVCLEVAAPNSCHRGPFAALERVLPLAERALGLQCWTSSRVSLQIELKRFGEAKDCLVNLAELRAVCTEDVVRGRQRDHLPIQARDRFAARQRHRELVPNRQTRDRNAVSAADAQHEIPRRALDLEVLTCQGECLFFQLVSSHSAVHERGIQRGCMRRNSWYSCLRHWQTSGILEHVGKPLSGSLVVLVLLIVNLIYDHRHGQYQ
mmetsp:Transcript_62478/g.145429  ORF Transcript_62478/g.145429 Transcript_62478/m.145429 type:complete len:234 (+) Transcript_62478:184-885(+)